MKFTPADAIIGVFLIACVAYFGVTLAISKPPAEFQDWKVNFSAEIANAILEYETDLDADHTDMGCVIAEQKFAKEINRILFYYKILILEEVNLVVPSESTPR